MALTSVPDRITQWVLGDGHEPPLLLVSEDEAYLQELREYTQQSAVCRDANKPCKVCIACKQALSGTHPDILVATGTTKTIGMKEIKLLLTAIEHTSLHGRRLVVIPQVEKLSPPAVSALLKSLEEPKAGTRFLLTSAFRRRILATIISRCMVLRVAPPSGAVTIETVALPKFGRPQDEQLTVAELTAIANDLHKRARHEGSSPELLRAWMRLRDYYKISGHRGNEKLAGQVLLATLSQLQQRS